MDVLGLERYVSERLDISPMSKERFDKLVSDKFTHLYFPKSKDDLCRVIDELVDEYGYECNLNVIDVSDITDMSGVFFNSKFNGDISMWNVSNATTMFAMFRNSKFNGALETEPVTFAPKFSSFSVASFLPIEDKVPVKTHVFPLK